MEEKEIIEKAELTIYEWNGKLVPVVDFAKPHDSAETKILLKIFSKLSPLVGNTIEYKTVDLLNLKSEKKWKRLDPGFPDIAYDGKGPKLGFEIKTWFPLATEITARFKESLNQLGTNKIFVVVIVWLPDKIIYGKPRVVGVWMDAAQSLALARDQHYHNPPDYLVIEPGDTTGRTSNLQQTNTNGYKFQGSKSEFEKAEKIVDSWGPNGKEYSPKIEYQLQLRTLLNNFSYRLDTNFAKIDRIEHEGLEKFKAIILGSEYGGRKISDWNRFLNDDQNIESMLKD